jgi:hypothetical protein
MPDIARLTLSEFCRKSEAHTTPSRPAVRARFQSRPACYTRAGHVRARGRLTLSRSTCSTSNITVYANRFEVHSTFIPFVPLSLCQSFVLSPALCPVARRWTLTHMPGQESSRARERRRPHARRAHNRDRAWRRSPSQLVRHRDSPSRSLLSARKAPAVPGVMLNPRCLGSDDAFGRRP